MKKIILLIVMVLFTMTMSAKNADGKRLNITKNDSVKVEYLNDGINNRQPKWYIVDNKFWMKIGSSKYLMSRNDMLNAYESKKYYGCYSIVRKRDGRSREFRFE